jgi:hypothetical protein
MTVDDSVMQKLWKLTNELTAQLVFNRNATLELKQQLADLQVSYFFPFCSLAGRDNRVFSLPSRPSLLVVGTSCSQLQYCSKGKKYPRRQQQ